MACNRAIIAVGGVGSRMLPWAYSGEKCMVPLIDTRGSKPVLRPVIDFIVEDCIRAGITDFTFVIGEGMFAIKKQYQGNEPVDRYFLSRGKAHLLDGIHDLNKRITFRFIEQPYGDHHYGTTVPVYLAKEVIDQPGQTIIIMGDQTFIDPQGGSEAANLLEGIERASATTGLLASHVPPERINHYGIFDVDEQGFMTRMAEKPAIGSTPSTLANASMYVVDRDLLPYIESNMQTNPNGNDEYYFTDVIGSYAQDGHKMAVITSVGTYLDCGTPESWLAANNFMATLPNL